MTKPLHDYVFMPVNGIWTDVKGDAGILADFLQSKQLIIDDRTQFARIYDYDEGVSYHYRSESRRVTITVWKIGN